MHECGPVAVLGGLGTALCPCCASVAPVKPPEHGGSEGLVLPTTCLSVSLIFRKDVSMGP